jgi:hypothetical protein
VLFAKQANVTTGLQQINNSVPPPSCPRESEITPNKLLETDGKRLDTRASGTSIGTDQELEAMGAINRPEVARR